MGATVFYLLMPQKYISSNYDSKIKPYPLCLQKISKDFSVNDIKKQDELDTFTIFLKEV